MGSPIFADDHSYELIREYAHLSRRKMTCILRDLIEPLEARLEKEHGVRIVDGKPVKGNGGITPKKAKAGK